MNVLDSHRIELPCPHCGHKIGKTLAQLKAQHGPITCRCGQSFNLDKAEFLKELNKAEESIAQLKRSLGSLR